MPQLRVLLDTNVAKRCAAQKRIGLESLKRLAPRECDFTGLGKAIHDEMHA